MSRHQGFLRGVLAALVLSLAGGAAMAGASVLMGVPLAFKMLVPLLGAAYLAYLLSGSEEKVGRVVVTLAWLVASCLIWAWSPTASIYVATHAALIWLVRSLYFHSSLITALADLGLVALGLGAAVWAVGHTGSLFLAIWCFFLVQALFVGIQVFDPSRKRATADVDGFQPAQSAAEKALRSLAHS